MVKEVKKAIQEFNPDIQSIETIKHWLENYNDLYITAKQNWNNDSCFGELPCSCTMNNDYGKFISFYDSLNKIAEYYKFEAFFKNVVEPKDLAQVVKAFVLMAFPLGLRFEFTWVQTISWG